jgi:hypothetical protein
MANQREVVNRFFLTLPQLSERGQNHGREFWWVRGNGQNSIPATILKGFQGV